MNAIGARAKTGSPASESTQQPIRGERDRPGAEDQIVEDEEPNDHQNHAGKAFNDRDERTVALEKLQECSECHSREEKGSTEASRVGDEQPETSGDRVGGARERQDRPENGPHARRPADREGESDDQGADVARRLLAELKLPRAGQESDAEQTGNREPEQDDEQ